ncbi:hypothetical protein CXB51_004468 [Gossypium anomalum]|uniref:DUF7745 domain-containing protein n=1 Tax=Gossypium anomalum TaxID=47600 RepID=A0A8J5ZNQ0_9ROSI|nr:hypothetical protein CXB51_004468 [Gossypium anomalum]
MRNEYLNKVENNASICTWSEKTQLKKGDSVTEGYTSELWDFTHINSTQNEFQELRDIWAQWDDEDKQLFYQNYGDLPYLLDVKEYTTLLRCPKIQGHKAYVRPSSLPTFTKKLVMITEMSEQREEKGRCPGFEYLWHGDFPKALGYIDEAVADSFDRLGKQNTLVPTILAETIRSLSVCRRAGEGRFIGCAQLLLKAVDMPRRDDISEERWIDILQNLREEDVMWKAPWLVPSEVLYRCDSFDWVPLPGIWRVVGYTPLLILRQYRARQFIPATQGLAQSDFSYKRDHYKKKMGEIFEAWKKPFCMKILTEGSTSTFEYKGWFSRRINDNVPTPILRVARSLEESLRVILSELEMEVEKVKKEKRKIEEDRDDLKTHYKKAQVTELGRSLHHHRSCNFAVELKASLNKIEEMKHNIGGLEAALQGCELQIKQLEAREEQWKGKLCHLRDQVGDRDHVMERALIQIRDVAKHLQNLAIQARTLSIIYESLSDSRRGLALLLDRIKTLGLRAKVYL